MAVYASLLSTIPMPQQNWQAKSNVPAVASVKVGDITDCVQEVSVQEPDSTGMFARLKNYFLQKRLKQLENIPPEKRTAVQQAELEANKQSLNCVV